MNYSFTKHDLSVHLKTMYVEALLLTSPDGFGYRQIVEPLSVVVAEPGKLMKRYLSLNPGAVETQNMPGNHEVHIQTSDAFHPAFFGRYDKEGQLTKTADVLATAQLQAEQYLQQAKLIFELPLAEREGSSWTMRYQYMVYKYIEALLVQHHTVNAKTLMHLFGMSRVIANKHIKELRNRFPEMMVYVPSTRQFARHSQFKDEFVQHLGKTSAKTYITAVESFFHKVEVSLAEHKPSEQVLPAEEDVCA
ncbi:hypothetical protein AB6D11_00735 [Vibrio splendidus]